MNHELEDIFLEPALYYDASGNYRGSYAFRNTANIMKNQKDDVIDIEKLKNTRGIGKSSYDIIIEYLETGSVERLENLRKEYTNMRKIIDEFTSIYGINIKTALKFYNRGFRKISDIWNYGNINNAQRQGILWREHLKLKIPRAEMIEIEKYLKSKIKDLIVVGSYRRGEPESGDIDVLVTSGESIASILGKIEDKIVVKLAQGKNKFMGIFRMSPENVGRRIDIRICGKKNVCAFMLLYFTGSQKFNKLIRTVAKNKGYKLSEYSLVDIETLEEIYLDTEEQIFQYLGLKYLEPNQRSRNISNILK